MAIKRASGYCQKFAKAQTHPLLGAEVILSKPVLERYVMFANARTHSLLGAEVILKKPVLEGM